MCDSTFAFGQRGSHFLQCPSTREVARLPSKLSALLSSAQLHRVYHVALGFEDSFLITWRDDQYQDRIDSYGIPTELKEFLCARNAQQAFVRNIPNIRCSLGPYNSSFFANDGSAYRWMNLPPSLLSALQTRIKDGSWIDQPRIVALGANDNFVMITQNHATIWDLAHYKTVANLLQFSKTQEDRISEIHYIVLHAHRFGSFITQSRNGTLIYDNLPPHSNPAMQIMLTPILNDTRALERTPPVRRESAFKENVQRRPSNLQRRAQLRRDWGEHKQQFTAQTKGMKVSLSLSVSIGRSAKLLG
ncbi:hypothetical protein BDU57DRAFT_346260 [Ampelomyces quisqualis]|uniref:Uncharacterized protein n=1 Tax=Ampelomyces quisqualis TaxID=50730 RepID=A0A6A5QCT8_AMPQU|nr:hypothetical protein BDU57DRAFT_346260 [Ampelomyces quisqualis]